MTKVRLLLLALLGVMGCGGSPFELDLTVHLGSDIDPGTEGRITTFVLDVTGGEAFTHAVELGRAPNQIERLVYHPNPTTRSLELTIDATDGTRTLASGSKNVVLGDGTTQVDLTLDLVSAMPDGGVDDLGDAGLDLESPSPDMVLDCPTNDVCLDFEGTFTPTGRAGAMASTIGTNCVLSTDRAWHGAQSMHCTSATSAGLSLSGGPTTDGGPIGFRAHIYTTAPSSTEVVYAQLRTADSQFVLQAEDPNDGNLGVSYTRVDSGPSTIPSTVADVGWHCIELLYAPPNAATFFIDGTQIGSATNVNLNQTTSPLLDVGFPSAISALTDIYVDDVVWGNGRIGCD